MAGKAEKEGEAVLMEILTDTAKHSCSKEEMVNQVKMVATVSPTCDLSMRRPFV
jgi:hypothetical protein